MTSIQHYQPDTNSNMQKFLVLFLPNTILQIAYLIYQYFIKANVDVRGWWPLVVVFIIVIYGALAGIYIFIDKLCSSDRVYTYIFAILWIVPFIAMVTTGWLYPIDWLAVNNGMAELTMGQTLGRYDSVYFVILLSVHALIRLYQRHKLATQNKK